MATRYEPTTRDWLEVLSLTPAFDEVFAGERTLAGAVAEFEAAREVHPGVSQDWVAVVDALLEQLNELEAIIDDQANALAEAKQAAEEVEDALELGSSYSRAIVVVDDRLLTDAERGELRDIQQQLQDEIDRYEEEMEALEAELADLDDEIAELEEAAAEAEDARADAEESVQEAEEAVADAEEALAAAEEGLAEAEEALAEAEDALGDAEENLSAAEESLDAAEEALADAEDGE